MADGATAPPLLSLRGVSKSFGPVQALTDVDLDVPAGAVTALAGDNGAGKSTLIKCIAGIHPPDSGEMLWEGKPVRIHGPADAAALGIQTVYQDLALVRQPGHRPEHVPRARAAASWPARRRVDGAGRRGDAHRARGDHRALGPPAGGLAVRRPAPVGRDRQGGAVGVQARRDGRADRRARRRPDPDGARPGPHGSPSAGTRCCSSRTTWSTCSRWPTGSRCCGTAGWSACGRSTEIDQRIVVDLMTTGTSDREPDAGSSGREARAEVRTATRGCTDGHARGGRRRRRPRARRRSAASADYLRAGLAADQGRRDRGAPGGRRPAPGLGPVPEPRRPLPDRRQPGQPARPGGGVRAAGDGRGVRPAARRDRPVGRLRRRHRRGRARVAVAAAGRLAVVGGDRRRAARDRGDRPAPGHADHPDRPAVVRRHPRRAAVLAGRDALRARQRRLDPDPGPGPHRDLQRHAVAARGLGRHARRRRRVRRRDLASRRAPPRVGAGRAACRRSPGPRSARRCSAGSG